MERALVMASTMALMDLPWFILCVLPFMPMQKVGSKILAFRILMIVSIIFLTMFLCGLFISDKNMTLINLVHAIAYLPALPIIHASFTAGRSKIFYIFFFEHALATEVNLLARHLTSDILHKASGIMDNWWLLFSGYLILIVVFPISWFLLKGPVRQVMVTLTEKQIRVLCVTPLLFFLTGGAYSLLMRKINFSGSQAVIFSLFFTFIGISAYSVNVITTNDIMKKSRLELEIMIMEQQLIRQSDRFEQLKELNAQSRQARHDLRHHLTVIRTYVKNKNYQKLEAYLDDYLSHSSKDSEQCICQNFAVDVLMKNYLALAQEAGAQVDVKIDLPTKCGIPDTQLCIVFGNLVENALHACRQQKKGEKVIRIRCRTEGKQIIASFDNSSDANMSIQIGTGLSSVKEVVKRYQGEFSYEMKQGFFQASLLLFIP